MHRTILLLAISIWTLGQSASLASTVYSDDFNGGLHLPWTFFNSALNPPSATTISTSLNDLRMTANTPPPYDALVGGVVGAGNPAYDFTDLTVRADVFPLTNTPLLAGGTGRSDNDIGIALRLDPVNFNEYSLIVDYVAHTLTMSVIVGGASSDLFLAIPGFDATKVYTLQFSAIGTQLTGKVFDGATLLQTISTTNSLFTHGNVTLGAQINNNTPVTSYIGAGFDNFSITVPEPTTCTLSVIALLALTAFASNRSTNRRQPRVTDNPETNSMPCEEARTCQEPTIAEFAIT